MSFAAALLARDCNVVFADLSLRPEARELVSRHAARNAGPRAVFVETDITSWPAISRMFDVALQEFGSFDIVCPGAGVYEPHWSNFWHPPGSAESRDDPAGGRYALLDINLTHPIRATQLALSHWLHPSRPAGSTLPLPQKASPRNPKRVIHISSVAAQLGVFRAPLYGASKFAITGFVRALAPLEPESGIRVSAVAPGIVRTPIWTEHPEKLVYVDQDLTGWVTPEEVALAMLTCIESSTMLGGTVLEVGKDSTREVLMFNDPGPDPRPEKGLQTGSTTAHEDARIWGWLGDESIWGRPPL